MQPPAFSTPSTVGKLSNVSFQNCDKPSRPDGARARRIKCGEPSCRPLCRRRHGTFFSTANDLLKLRFPETQASLDVHPLSVNGIAGVTARFNAPVEGHVHRTPGDILHYYATASNLSEAALEVAHRIWHNVASAEAACTTVRLNPFIFTKWAA